MKREDLKAKGMTDEHIDFALDEFHKEQELLKGQVQTLTSERDAARDEVKKYEQILKEPTISKCTIPLKKYCKTLKGIANSLNLPHPL